MSAAGDFWFRNRLEDVDAALGALLDEFEPDECARYHGAAGYQSTSGEQALSHRTPNQAKNAAY